MDQVAVSVRQRHALLAQRYQNGLGVGRPERLDRCVGDIFVGMDSAARRLGEFLLVRRQQRRPAIDREICAFRIDDDPLPELARRVDDMPDHPGSQHALRVVREQHDIGARQGGNGRIDQLTFDPFRRRCCNLPIGTKHVC